MALKMNPKTKSRKVYVKTIQNDKSKSIDKKVVKLGKILFCIKINILIYITYKYQIDKGQFVADFGFTKHRKEAKKNKV